LQEVGGLAMFEASLLTSRLLLAPMTRDDIPDLAAIASDESIFRYIPDIRLPFDAGPWVRSMLANDEHLIRHVIRLRGTAEPVGFFRSACAGTPIFSWGTSWRAVSGGRQLAVEACESALTLLTDAGIARPVFAAVHRDNVASLRVMRKLHFEPSDLPRPLSGVGPDMIDHCGNGGNLPGPESRQVPCRSRRRSPRGGDGACR
jgi:RimJ/RimL family protein N-acetyltransferase